jgi:ABC-2 type transport system ATP-binding protein
MIISVSQLSKRYRVYQKEAGFFGSLKSLVHRTYTDAKAVDDISFTIDTGELVGFIGPNGAGKTTTLKCLSGLLYPTSGTVKVLGFTPFQRKHAFLKQISLVMGQKNQLWWDLPASDSFLLNKEIYEVSDTQYKKVLGDLVDLLDVSAVLNVQVRKLSLGQRMKCELIAALLHQPKIIFLDEPTIGLDVLMQQKLREFIREYNERYNATVILTSHYMKDVEALCKRVIIIDHGRILYDGSLAQIIHQYSKHKIITVVFSQKVPRDRLEQIGEIVSYADLQVTLSVPREISSTIAATLLSTFPVDDVTIEEPNIEEIIGDVFAKK